MKGDIRKMDLQAINLEINRALSFEDKFSRFTALSDVAVLTSSSADIPEVIKDRVLKRIEKEQQKFAYDYPIEQESLDEDLRHEDMENPIAFDVK